MQSPIDPHPASSDNGTMSISFPTTDADNLARSLERVATKKRDPERMRKAIEEMDRSREETRKKIGTVDVAVDLIRDARNQ
jgi:hypothetical protein